MFPGVGPSDGHSPVQSELSLLADVLMVKGVPRQQEECRTRVGDRNVGFRNG